MARRLYKSKSERMLFGVAGGIAEYFDFDPTLVRLAWVLGTVVTGGTVGLAYLVAALIAPNRAETGATSAIPAAGNEPSGGDSHAEDPNPSAKSGVAGRRLYKSRSERMLFGVSGGIAEYFAFDPTLVRLAWVFGALVTAGSVILAYLVMALVVPSSSEVRS